MVDDIITDTDWNALHVGSEWTESESGKGVVIEDPSTRETVAHVPRGTETSVDAAYEAAAETQGSWAEAPPARRQEVVEQFLQALNEYEDEVIDLLAHEVGDSRIMGGTFIQIVFGHTNRVTTLPRRMRGEYVISNIPGKENIVQRNPKGVMAVISPQNFPLDLSVRAVVPAVVMGNAVVLRPSTSSPITGGLLFAKLFEEINLPEGTVNTTTGRGSEIGDRAAGHPGSDVVAFTGPTEIGKCVSGIADENLVMLAMELGGNNAHVVTEGTDVDRATDTVVFRNSVHQGQVCIPINRHVVHESVYDEYAEKLTERAAELPVDSIHEDDMVIGPIIDRFQCDEMLGYVEETVTAGAALETDGPMADLDGVDDSPAVQPITLSGVTNGMAAAHNEYFDPIAPVIPLSDVDETVEPASAAEYGLSGSVHVGDLATGKEIALRMEIGNVHVDDQPISDEVHTLFSGTGVPGVGTYNSDALLDEVIEDNQISL